VYLKSKIEKLSQIETQNLDYKSPDYHEHFSTKSIDESKASVYFTPNEGHLSPQPQFSPIHINYINDTEAGNEAAGGFDDTKISWPLSCFKNSVHGLRSAQRNSFQLPSDYLDEEDESGMGNFIVPDPVYCDEPCRSIEKFQDVIDLEMDSGSIASFSSTNRSTRRRKKKYRDRERRKSALSVENQAFLMQEMIDVSKGARPKIYDISSRNNISSENKGKTIYVKQQQESISLILF
jgi:hypothetical protein